MSSEFRVPGSEDPVLGTRNPELGTRNNVTMAVQLPALEALRPLDELRVRLQRAADHLAQLPAERLFGGFERARSPGGRHVWAYGGDYAGRWLEAVSVLSRLQGLRLPAYPIQQTVDRLISYQAGDGFFGHTRNSNEYFGAGRALLGLIEAYVTAGYGPALHAAERLVRHWQAAFPLQTNQRYAAALEAVVRFASVTGDRASLALAARIFDHSTALGQLSDFGQAAGNFHMLITAHRGAVDLYGLTNEGRYLSQAIAFWRWVRDHKMLVSGGLPEWLQPHGAAAAVDRDPLFATDEASKGVRGGTSSGRPEHAASAAAWWEAGQPGREKCDEGCTVADWLRLCLQLWRYTQEEEYLDTAELVFWNHFLFGQAANGGWCGRRSLWGDYGAVWDFCCAHHGPRALCEALRYAIVIDAGACNGIAPHPEGHSQETQGATILLRVGLPLPVAVDLPVGPRQATLAIRPAVAADRYEIACAWHGPQAPPEDLVLAVRRPIWSSTLELGSSAPGVAPAAAAGGHGEREGVQGRWRYVAVRPPAPAAQVQIACRLTPALRELARIGEQAPARAAVLGYGPYVLAQVGPSVPPPPGAGLVRVGENATAHTLAWEIDLEGRFARLLANAWVQETVMPFTTGDEGVLFAALADGRLAAESRLLCGTDPSWHVDVRLDGVQTLRLEARASSGAVPARAGRWTDVRLIDANGRVLVLDSAPRGGPLALPEPWWLPPAAELAEGREAAVESASEPDGAGPAWSVWSAHVTTRTAAGAPVGLRLIPLKDVLGEPCRPDTAGHLHSVTGPPFRVWLPQEEEKGR